MRAARIRTCDSSQILDVKEVYALAEDLRLMVLLDPEALSRMTPPETLLKHFLNIFVCHGPCESFWGRDGKTPFDLQGFLLREEQKCAREADRGNGK